MTAPAQPATAGAYCDAHPWSRGCDPNETFRRRVQELPVDLRLANSLESRVRPGLQGRRAIGPRPAIFAESDLDLDLCHELANDLKKSVRDQGFGEDVKYPGAAGIGVNAGRIGCVRHQHHLLAGACGVNAPRSLDAILRGKAAVKDDDAEALAFRQNERAGAVHDFADGMPGSLKQQAEQGTDGLALVRNQYRHENLLTCIAETRRGERERMFGRTRGLGKRMLPATPAVRMGSRSICQAGSTPASPAR